MVTVTSTVPVPAGLVAVIWVSESTLNVGGAGGAEADVGGAGEPAAGDGHGVPPAAPRWGRPAVTAGAAPV